LAIAIGITSVQLIGKEPWALELSLRSGGMMLFDFSAQLFSLILLVGLFLVLLGFKPLKTIGADLLGLLMFSLCGGMLLTGFTHLVMMFLGIEVLSIPLYVLAGAQKTNKSSNEAAIKYFLMGAFSTAILLMGCAFIYGGTGTLELEGLNRATYMQGHMKLATPLVFGGVLLIFIGFLFKVAAVPFHFWTPDVYEGSPTRATVFMATVVKIAAFAGLIRLFAIGFGELKDPVWLNTLAIASALSIVIGNATATIQKNAKRLLAYSGIAQAGYMLIAFVGNNYSTDIWNLWVYAGAYIFASVIVFTIIGIVEENGNSSDLESFRGLSIHNKFLAFALVVAMFSMAGIPLTMGFVGKYGILTAAFGVKPWLVVIALVGSAIGIGVYFSFFKQAILSRTDKPLNKLKVSLSQNIALVISVAAILIIGILPLLLTNIKDFFIN